MITLTRECVIAMICNVEINMHLVRHYGFRAYCKNMGFMGYWTWDEEKLSGCTDEQLVKLLTQLMKIKHKFWR